MDVWRSGEVLEVPMEQTLVDRYEKFQENGAQAVSPRLAATVMLVRPSLPGDSQPEGGDILNAPPREVFMLRRAKTMAFVPDAVVFPGGGVDPRDGDARLPWKGPEPAVWAQRMGVDEETARRVIVAAAREVFEECGVLLAGKEGDVVRDVSRPEWDEERQRLAEHESSFAEVLMRHDLVLRADLLGLRSHWLTPVYEPRRYDTYFFAALAPQGQTPDDRTTEANGAGWVDARRILEGGNQGKVQLMAPTRYNLMHLINAPSVRDFVSGTAHTERIMLQPGRRETGEAVLRCQLP
ncbi:NUDIX hydrolase [Eggerthella sp. YY7918]|uniref:NUDIX hydrolase n=1 Tax=Eggerthella sp. (strain YY7918) TaxID=502558 RepID=UPI0002171580|nr:NUDIX hydrolase [Eggerthella sp. YY7918]BAK44946.1 hypothetical protein EGYY_18110 [Eggerthella sp. YY7918]